MLTNISDGAHAVIQKIIRDATRVVSPTQLTGLIKTHLDQILPSDRLGVLFWDPDDNRINHEAHAGLDLSSDTLPFGYGYPPNIQKMISTPKVETDLGSFPGERVQAYTESGVQTLAHVPLMSRANLLGALALFSTQPNAYSSADLELLVEISEAVSPFLENSALIYRLRAEISVRNAVSELSRRAAAADRASDIYAELHHVLKGLLQFERFAVLRFHPDMMVKHAFVRGTEVKNLGQGKMSRVSERALRYLSEPRLEERVTLPGINESPDHGTFRLVDAGLVSQNMHVPLTTGGRQLGSISVWAGRFSNYGKRDLELLATLARQVAPVIEKLELRETAERESRFRTALATVTKSASESSSLHESLKVVYRATADLIPHDRFTVVLPAADPDIQLRAFVRGTKIEGREEGSLTLPAYNKEQRERGANLRGQATTYAPDEYAKRAGLNSGISVPMFTEDKLIGEIVLLSTAPDAFELEHHRILAELADHIAPILERFRLLEEQTRLASRASALAAISKEITSSSSPSDGAGAISQCLAEMIKLDGWNVRVFNEPEHTVMTLASNDEFGLLGESRKPDVPNPLAGTLSEHIFQTKTGILAGRNQINDVTTQFPGDVLPPVGSFMAAPLVNGSKCVGALYAFSKDPVDYTESDLEVLQSVANQMVGAIENGQLLQESQQLSERLDAIAEISRLFSNSPVPREIASAMTPLLKRVIDHDSWAIRLVDEEEKSVFTFARDGIPEAMNPETAVGISRPITGRIIEEILQTRAPVTADISDLKKVEGKYPGAKINPAATIVAVPMIAGDRCVGALFVDSLTPKTYSDSDIETLQTVADQIAGAVANSELLLQVMQDATERAAMLEIAAILSRQTGIDKIPGELANQLYAALPAATCAVWIVDFITGEGRVISAAGEDVQPFSTGTRLNLTRDELDAFDRLPVSIILLADRGSCRLYAQEHADGASRE